MTANRTTTGTWWPEVFAGQRTAILLGCIGSVLVMSGSLLAAVLVQSGRSNAILSVLAAGAVWVAIASGVFAASGRGWWATFLRAGVIADSCGVALAIFWAVGLAIWPQGSIALLSAVKVYCVYAVLSLLSASAVQLARREAWRYALAAASAGVLLAAMASPFWINGLLESAAAESRPAITTAAVQYNPFYSITSAVYGDTQRIWHESHVLYSISVIANRSPGVVPWHGALLRCAIITAFLAAIALVKQICFTGRSKAADM